MSISVEIDKAKEIAEQYLDSKKETNELKKILSDLFDGSDVEINEVLPNGGVLSYKVVQPKPKFDYVSYTAFLTNELKKGAKYTDSELESIMHNFAIQKKEKWTLKVTK